MSMPIRHPLNGEATSPLGEFASEGKGFFADIAAWLQRSPAAPVPAARRPRVHRESRRETRGVFHHLAASDLAYRDVASQIWTTPRTR